MQTESPLPTVWHAGQTEAAPGGMSQVIRAYLAWPFVHSTQRPLPTHVSGSWLKRLAVAGRALATVMVRPRAGDVVVVHLSEDGSFVREGAVLAVASLRGITTVAQLHGARFVAFARTHQRLTRFVLGRARRCLALNAETLAEVRRLVPSLDIVLLPNAVEAAPRHDKEPLVVFGGEVGTRKGADVLVRAWKALPTRNGHRLIFAGPIADESIVDRDAPDVEYVGPVSHEDLLALLDRSRIACLPSHLEGMPMFVLEAMGRGNCVVSTTVGGIPELLEDGAGILVPPGDEERLAEALDRAINGNVAQRYADAAHARVAQRYAREIVFPVVEEAWLGARNASG